MKIFKIEFLLDLPWFLPR